MLLKLFVILLANFAWANNLPTKPELEKGIQDVPEAEDTLIFANVIFRHGYRTPTDVSSYKNDPYRYKSYWPYGIGGLTKEGKLQMYKLGLELRKRYGSFLGKTYFPELIGALSSPSSRCQTSLQSVFAGMFPPNIEDLFVEDLPWQPFVYDILSGDRDDTFALYDCDGYWPGSTPNKTIQEFYEYIGKHSGDSITNNSAVFIFHDCVDTQTRLGLQQPDWIAQIFPEPLTSIAHLSYYDLLHSRMHFGASGIYSRLVKSFKDKLEGQQSPTSRKMMLYSGHEQTLFYALAAITTYDGTVPTYASYLAFELHYILGEFGIKVYFQNYAGKAPVPIKILGEGEFVTLEKFFEGVGWLTDKKHPHCQFN